MIHGASAAAGSDGEPVDDWDLADCDAELLAVSAKQAELVGGRAYHQMSPDEAREAYRLISRSRASDPGSLPVGSISDEWLPVASTEIHVRIYTPVGDGPWPVVVFFHGGGWIFGDVETYDDTSRWICAESEAVVVSVGYVLAPEHRFPAPLLSCIEALRWTQHNISDFGGDPAAIVVMGDSAGGNLAAAVALEASGQDLRLIGQVILYAPLVHVDHTAAANVEPWPRRRQRFGPTYASTQWYWENYVGPTATGLDPRASVLLRQDFSAAPPALIAYGALDTYGTECVAYGNALRTAGVPVTVRSFPRIGHGFLAHGPMPRGHRSSAAHTAAAQVCADVKVLARTGRLP